jgi:hypothetical protein
MVKKDNHASRALKSDQCWVFFTARVCICLGYMLNSHSVHHKYQYTQRVMTAGGFKKLSSCNVKRKTTFHFLIVEWVPLAIIYDYKKTPAAYRQTRSAIGLEALYYATFRIVFYCSWKHQIKMTMFFPGWPERGLERIPGLILVVKKRQKAKIDDDGLYRLSSA